MAKACIYYDKILNYHKTFHSADADTHKDIFILMKSGEKNPYYLISFVRLEVKLLWHHKSRVIVLEKSLLIDSRVQIRNALVHSINAGLLGLFKALFSTNGDHESVSNGGVETKVHALFEKERKTNQLN